MTEQTEQSPASTERKPQPRKVGVVTSDKSQKTLTVKVERLVKHPLYRKYVRRRTILKVHDEEQAAKVGDRVEVEFSRPISKSKRWRLIRVLDRSES